MTGTFKGLFKGLRYFSQIFDSKEQEMQIGVPTDVKHVSHIGWDGTSSNPPSWMAGFKSVPELANETPTPIVESNKAAKKLPSEGTQDSKNEKPKNKTRRKAAAGNDSTLNSPKGSDAAKQSRRHFTTNTTLDSSKGNDSPLNSPKGSDGTKQSRHHFTTNTILDSSKENQHKFNLSIEGSSPNPDGIPKQSRRKKVKGATCDGSTKSFGAESGQRTKNKQRELSSVVEENEEEKG